jgi:hypothetical protein
MSRRYIDVVKAVEAGAQGYPQLRIPHFASLFDHYYARVPVLRGDVSDDAIFVGDVHLDDPGNAIVACELGRIVCDGSKELKADCQ